MQAIILAAEMGKKLRELTHDNANCMVEVNGVTLIDRMLHQIEKQHVSRIVIVVGYEGQKLIEYIATLGIQTPIVYVNNPIYDKTNNIYSLALAKEYLCQEDTLIFESDLIFEDSIVEELVNDPRDTLALVDKYAAWMDGTCIKIGQDDEIEAFVADRNFKFSEINDYYKMVDIYKFSKHFSETYYVPLLDAYKNALGENENNEQLLRVITMLDAPKIKVKRLNGQLWYEINDIQDLDIASCMFMPDEDMNVDLFTERYGGYWRYPYIMDFYYLVNPYFPPQKLMDEIKANFETLLIQYPSGMRVNSLLAAKNFNVHQENILVGNGAAELIKAVMDCLTGNVGIIRPTFEEYGHRYREEELVVYWPQNDDFSYTAVDLMKFFGDKDIQNLILINPDNPSGNYIPKNDLLELVQWAKDKGIKIIVDESFVDFADENNSTIIEQNILDENPHLIVLKSISKSYGVPGLRLGVLASGDISRISQMKKDVSIWNINSFAEFYMQIQGKYIKEFEKALVLFREERKRYIERLNEIAALRVIPSQANYVMVEITNGLSAKELNRRLIIEYNIIIKNLVSKVSRGGRQYIRLAVKTTEENNRLVNVLKEILG